MCCCFGSSCWPGVKRYTEGRDPPTHILPNGGIHKTLVETLNDVANPTRRRQPLHSVRMIGSLHCTVSPRRFFDTHIVQGAGGGGVAVTCVPSIVSTEQRAGTYFPPKRSYNAVRTRKGPVDLALRPASKTPCQRHRRQNIGRNSMHSGAMYIYTALGNAVEWCCLYRGGPSAVTVE